MTGQGLEKLDCRMISALGPSFHGGSQKQSDWQVSWLGDRPFFAPSQVFPSGMLRSRSPLTVAGQRGIFTHLSFYPHAKCGTRTNKSVWILVAVKQLKVKSKSGFIGFFHIPP